MDPTACIRLLMIHDYDSNAMARGRTRSGEPLSDFSRMLRALAALYAGFRATCKCSAAGNRASTCFP